MKERATIENLPRRFWAKVDKSGECWLWTGGCGGKGNTRYGVFRISASERHTTAHRIAYLLTVGPIPDGFEIDHLCRTTRCVRPEHLEAVTPAENRRRQFSHQTHCKNGHLMIPENRYFAKGRNSSSCRLCRTPKPYSPPKSQRALEAKRKRHREYMREYNRRKRAGA